MQRKKTELEKRKEQLFRELVQISGINSAEGAQNLIKEMLSGTLQQMLESEMDEKLGYSKYDYKNKNTDNSRNGYSTKSIDTSNGEIELEIPRDRNGEFEPKIIGKYETRLSGDIEEKIISMYAKGMTQADISDHIKDLYGFEISDASISKITDKILPVAKEWQTRPLENIYAMVFMDAIHYHVRSEGRIVKKACYIAIGTDLEGKKEVLGLWIGENESAKYWLNVLNGLKSRGVEDILIACTDHLPGFTEAINAAYPKTDVQHCIIHQIRNSTKYVSYKDLKALMLDLKTIYRADTENSALENLEKFNEIWGKKYPKIYESWYSDWANLSTYFSYPPEIRKVIYTTNQIENFNRCLRKVTKARTVFPTDDSLFKMLYLATMDITKKWTGSRYDWKPIYMQLEIYFGDRITRP